MAPDGADEQKLTSRPQPAADSADTAAPSIGTADPAATVEESDRSDPDAATPGSRTVDEFDDTPVPSLVRPYTLTAGRTKSEVYLPLEAPVHTVSMLAPSSWPATDARAKIVALCGDGPSVAEISAKLKLPLGVARVLVGDLVTSGILRVSETLDDDATADERRELIGRTLRGLRAL